MSSINHSNNLSLVTLPFLPSTSPPSSAASPSSTSSTGWTKKIEELKSKLESLNNLKEAKNGYLPEKDSKSLDSLPTQLASLETVHKLAEFADQLDTNKNNPNNLLNNLCTGLETFLGFNSETKGYDGSGIVYSDLDRLCDGVMGFLSGVLGAVKDDDAVKTYDKYISGNRIDTVIKTLNDKIGSGRDGLAVSVDAVKEWLERYGKKLDEYNNKLISPLSELNSNIKQHKSTFISMKNDSVSEQHNKWTAEAIKYFGHAEQAKNALNNLDPRLQNTLATPMGKIHTAVKVICDVANDPELAAQVGIVVDQMKAKKEDVVREIQTKCSDIRLMVQTALGDINSKIEFVDAERIFKLGPLKDSIANLVTHVDDANKAAQKLEREYGEHIVNGLKNVSDNIVDVSTDPISIQLQQLFAQVNSQLKSAEQLIQELQHIHTTVAQEVERDEVSLKSELAAQIHTLKESLKSGISEYISGQLPGRLKKVISGLTVGIASDNGKEGILGDIVTGVKVYADEFLKERHKFAEVIKRWITDILKDNTMVKGSLESYFKLPRNTSKLNNNYKISNEVNYDEVRKKIAEAIKTNINAEIDSAAFIPPRSGTIYDNVAEICRGIEAFATALNSRIQGVIVTPDDNVVDKIVTEITKQGPDVTCIFSSDPGDSKDIFTTTVTLVLTALVSAAKRFAQELETFANEKCSLGTNVHNAIIAIKQLASNIERALKPDGETFGNAIRRELETKITTGDVDDRITVLLMGASVEGIERLNARMGSILPNLSRVRSSIEIEMDKLKHKSTPSTSNIEQLVVTLRSEIERVKNFVTLTNRKAESSIKTQVTSLEMNVASILVGIKQIYQNIQEFDKSLQAAIQEVKQDVISTREALHTHISKDTEALAKTAEQAFEAVTREIQSMFAKQHEADLIALKNLVDGQNAAITDIINKDNKNRLKGFLNKLNSQFVPEIPDFGVGSDITFTRFADELNEGFQDFLKELEKQDVILPCVKHIHPVSRTLDVLLSQMEKSQHFGSEVTKRRLDLENTLSEFNAEGFHDAVRVICVPLKNGLQKFVDELKKAYVNKYEGGLTITQWVTDDAEQNQEQDAEQKPKQDAEQRDDQDAGQGANQKYKLTDEGRKGALVCLTSSTTLYNYLHFLFYNCATWWNKYAVDGSMTTDQSRYSLRKYLASQGFDVVNLITKDHSGWHVAIKLSKGFNGHGEFNRQPDKGKIYEVYIDSIKKSEHPGILQKLFDYLCTYYQVCHLLLPETPKYPCTVRDMLSWLTGLTHTTVYTKINKQSESLLKEKDNVTGEMPYYDDFVIRRILTSELYYSLYSTCRISYDALTTIQGHGHGFDQADYPYACNFMDNSRGFHYPDNVGGLFDMLSDICRRLLYALYYTYSRCRTPSHVHGWRSCQYGKDVDSFNWDCDKHPNGKSNCQPRSSLQSHLMDNLAGFLPHKVTSNGTSLSCSSCKSSQPGQQCVTPMGFSDLSSAGSRNGTGEDICNVLKGFCGNADSPLCSLLRCLSTLCPVAPKGLAEMFSLFCNIMQRSHNSKYTSNDGYKSALDGAIDKSFPFKNCKSLHDNYAAANLTNALENLYCNTTNHPNNATQEMNHCDLWSVSRPALTDSHAVCKNINGACAPYLQPLGLHAHHTYAEKHAGIYLSWFIHLTWQFWELLHGLLDAFTNMSCKAYGCSCNCPPGKHGVCDEDASVPQKPSKPSCYCPSVVNCHGVMSTFYKYGFTFRVPGELYTVGMTKKCEQFVNQMKKVLYKGHFEELFKQIDNFVWAIRLPFFWLTLALWLLSLLYLIHIMVIRLDLLHIKSHLHSPSSHRIAAQSLLAAARVNKLNRVFYLQP